MPTCGSLFSGAGLLDCGLALAGFEHAWLCESVPERRDLLRARFPGVPVFEDVRTVRGPFAADADGYALREQSEPVAGSSSPAVAGRAREASADAAQERRSSAASLNGERGMGQADRGDGDRASRVDLVAGGFPCRGVSTAGKREGLDNTETVLWGEMRRLIGELQPRYVLLENVANLLTMAARPGEPTGSLWGSVLAEMAALGFDVRWDVLPAAAVGAPHLRERVFAVGVRRDGARAGAECAEVGGHGDDAAAGDADRMAGEAPGPRNGRPGTLAQPGTFQRTQRSDGIAGPAPDSGESGRRAAERNLWPGQPDAEGIPTADPDGPGGQGWPVRADADDPATGVVDGDAGRGVAVDWGDYRPAINRWEDIHGPAPEPLIGRLDDGGAKVQRMRARLDRQRLSALGDGVHVYVGRLVGQYVMQLIEQERTP